jgi:hypothetical protein
MRRLIACVFSIACSSPAQPRVATQPAARVLVNVDAAGVALGGNDPIAYASDGAVPGVAELEAAHAGAKYRFATRDHEATFVAAPANHAPAYGGYCAFAASQNRLSASDPEVFLILDGQLLMFTNREFLAQFERDRAGNKAKADANWPGLVAKFGK